MKLTPFGETVRTLRMRYEVSMKSMAEALGISSSYMSGIEYGEKTLADKYADAAVLFFRGHATPEELQRLKAAAAQSKDVVSVSKLEPDARRLVAAFARRLQDGAQPSKEMNEWLESKYPEENDK
ncbi:helix-turn-helix transcriptional regulator [Mitsuaria sp. TWR114]|uniref:helix-turn-helix domain-containing protein n=1 Tax=Mitsuaria sp. TWR114 TaxID=2601731 RepID=UPI0011BD450A|nr:helix-turn-helix transcriptional regulator [Mitsuaria sp. TWR114]TXD86664.1 helix-turn-helix transcriptional regulator [Mitsuaria sp. TWR114]